MVVAAALTFGTAAELALRSVALLHLTFLLALAEVLGPGLEKLAFGAANGGSSAEEPAGPWASAPGPAYYSGSSSSSAGLVLVLGLELELGPGLEG